MQETDVGGLIRAAMIVVLKMSGPRRPGGGAGGGLMCKVQAVTQINEQTLTFVPKLLAIGGTLLVLGGFMVTTLSDFTRMLFDHLVAIGGR
jgi:flagellar biosynthetic protein FliQ